MNGHNPVNDRRRTMRAVIAGDVAAASARRRAAAGRGYDMGLTEREIKEVFADYQWHIREPDIKAALQPPPLAGRESNK